MTLEKPAVRQGYLFLKGQPTRSPFTDVMREAIDSERGRRLYGRRMASVEPVFGNLRTFNCIIKSPPDCRLPTYNQLSKKRGSYD